MVDKKDIITGENLKAGDVLIGMASTGVHSNGFSLVRKIFKMDKETLNTYHEELGKTLGEALLAPTRIYVKALKNVKEAGVRVKAVAVSMRTFLECYRKANMQSSKKTAMKYRLSLK